MCSFCVVPFTRGRERSRDAGSIVAECTDLFESGFKEVTLLGQNVDSYHWTDDKTGKAVTFAEFLEKVALISPMLRVRFSTSHPKDITDQVLHTMAKYNKYLQIYSSALTKRINKDTAIDEQNLYPRMVYG